MSDDVFRRAIIADLKRKVRAAKLRYSKINRLKALPKIKTVRIDANYVNPVTLNSVPSGPAVYEVKNATTGRVDYYDKKTFWKLMPVKVKNNYNLLMADPKTALFKNPITRGNVKPRNVTRVHLKKKITRSVAVKKIQNAVRKHIKKKKSIKK